MLREELIQLINVISLNAITENTYYEICLDRNAAVLEVHDWNLWQRTCYSDCCFINFTSDKSDVWLTLHRNSVWIRKTN
jgi:hypothetical protein